MFYKTGQVHIILVSIQYGWIRNVLVSNPLIFSWLVVNLQRCVCTVCICICNKMLHVKTLYTNLQNDKLWTWYKTETQSVLNQVKRIHQDKSKVWIYPVQFVMNKDRIIKLMKPFKEIKFNFSVTTTTLPISPKWVFWGLGQLKPHQA